MDLENKLLPTGSFSKKQRAFLHRYDIVIASLTVLAAAIILFVVPFGAPYYGGYYGKDIDTYITLGIAVGALTLFVSSIFLFMKTSNEHNTSTERLALYPFKASFVSLAVICLMTIPWSFIYLADDAPVLHAIFGAPTTILLAVLFGFTAWCMASVPLAILSRAIYRLAVQRDRSMLVPLTLGCFILLLGSLVVIAPIAMDLEIPGKIGGIAGIMALLGVPSNNVTVEDEAAFLLGHCVVYVAFAVLVAHLVLKAHFKKTK